MKTTKSVQDLDSQSSDTDFGEDGAVLCMEALEDATAVLTADSSIAYANPVARKLLGFNTPLPRHIADLTIDARWNEHLTMFVKEAITSGKLIEWESEQTLAGKRYHFQEKFVPSVTATGQRRVLWCCRDVTVQKKHEMQLEAERLILERIIGGRSIPETLASICSMVELKNEGVHCAIQLEGPTQRQLRLLFPSPDENDTAPFIATSGQCSCVFAHFNLITLAPNHKSECRPDRHSPKAKGVRSMPIVDESGEELGTLILIIEQSGESPYPLRQTMLGAAKLTVLALSRELEKADSYRRERIYSSLVENSLDLILLVNEDLSLEYASPSVERLLGYAQGDVLTRLVLNFIPQPLRQSVREDLAKVFSSGTAKSLGDVEIVAADGSVRTFEFVGELLNVQASTLPGVVLSGRDVTEKRHAEAKQKQLRHALYYAAQEWRTTFDSVPTPLIVVDTKQRIRRLNQAAQALFHKSFRELIGRSLSEFHSRVLDKASELVAKALSSSQSAWETVTDSALGKSWEVISSPITGDVEHRHILIIQDITELLKLQESNRQAEKMSALGSLVAGVAHEVRNPLFAISGVVSSLAQLIRDRDDLNEHVDVLQTEVNRLSKLMYELLDYGKPPKLTRRPGDLTASVYSAQKQVEALAAQARIKVVTELIGEPPSFEFDFDRITSAVRNLLENAIQHSPTDTSVICRISSSASHYCVTVTDHGDGISDGDLPQLFEPFFTRRPGGTGLGLPIVKRIVEQHGGRLIVKSRYDEGTSITLEFLRERK